MSLLPERFTSKVEIDPTTECWNWQGTTHGSPRGGARYGRFWWRGRLEGAHRFAYEHAVAPIPAGLQIDHLCRNTLCVNPAHLEPVTQRENILRGSTVSGINARKTHCNSGHEFTTENAYLYKGARLCRICSLERKRSIRAQRKAAA